MVWLLDLSYKLTDRQWLLTHNHRFSVTDCVSSLRRYYDLGYVHCQMSDSFMLELRQACSALYVVRAISERFGLHAGNTKINKQIEE